MEEVNISKFLTYCKEGNIKKIQDIIHLIDFSNSNSLGVQGFMMLFLLLFLILKK